MTTKFGVPLNPKTWTEADKRRFKSLLKKQRVEWWLAKEGRAEPDSGSLRR
jgi:hypothetical protein